MLPAETDVTWRRSPSTEPLKETETGAIELPVVVAATGNFALSAVSIEVAAAAKLATFERLIDPEYAYP